ncbi:MAG: hypothetical protein WCA19_03025, partial [Candidatus Acidiferrales bacterium]
SGEVNKEMAGGVATADGLQDFDLHGPTEGSFPNGLMGSASAVAMNIVGFAGAVPRGGAEATVSVDGAVTNVDGVAFAPGFKTGMQGFDELLDTALTLLGNVLLELEAIEASTSTFAEKLDFGGLVDL